MTEPIVSLSISQAAIRLKVSTRTIHNLIKRGQLNYKQVGISRRILIDDYFDSYIKYNHKD